MSLPYIPFNTLIRLLPPEFRWYIIVIRKFLREQRLYPMNERRLLPQNELRLALRNLDIANEQWAELIRSTVEPEEHEPMQLDLVNGSRGQRDDLSGGSSSSFPVGRTNNIPRPPFDPSDFKIKQYVTHSNQSTFNEYFKELKSSFKDKHFTYVFDHLKGSPSVVFMCKELVRFFNKELKRKKTNHVIRSLHAIHSLISNPQCEPEIIARVLKEDNFFSHLFDKRCLYNYSSFCFLTKEIFIDILSELFHKVHPREWAEYYLKWLSALFVKYFSDIKKPPHIYFNAIATSLVIGVEALPLEFYPSLIFYFRYLIEVMPRNRLSSHYLLKVWDELMLFFRHWIRYLFCYPYLNCLNPTYSKLKFRHCENPDPCILQNDLENRIIRNQMKYEYLHVEGGYVPCEFPSIPSFPKLPKTFPTLKDMEKAYGNLMMMSGDIIGIGYCEGCKQTKCSCVSSFIIAYDVLDHILSEVEKMQELSPELSMEFQNASLYEQNKSSRPEKTQFCFDPSDSSDEDMTPDEISDCYDSHIKCSPTISYSFSPDPILEVWEKKVMPDFTDIFPAETNETNSPVPEQMDVVTEQMDVVMDEEDVAMDEEDGVMEDGPIHCNHTEFLNKSTDVQFKLPNHVVNHVNSLGNK